MTWRLPFLTGPACVTLFHFVDRDEGMLKNACVKLVVVLWMTLATVASAAASTSPGSDIYNNPGAYAGSSANGVGAVASVHPLATRAGLQALEQGGNAIDAAVAVALTLGVVDSHNSGIGGGCFALVRLADGRILALDGREMAPAAATRDMYLRDGEADNRLSTTGPLAVGVPGSLAVYDYLLKQAGKLSLQQLIAPAATLAEEGFPLSSASGQRLAYTAADIRRFPATAAILLNDKGRPWPVGHRLVQRDLAATYRHIGKQGIDYFYRGEFARAVGDWMQANGGILRYQDFADYVMQVREPISSRYRDYTVVGFPPPSSGGVHVAQILNMLAQFDIPALTEAQRYHLLVESMRRAFADRAYFLGDPDFVPVPRGLVDPGYAAQQAESIRLDKVSGPVEHGMPPGAAIDIFGKHTTHISTADRFGNWVAITTTVNTSFGSKVIVPGTGVILNNQMDDFSIQPGVPNAFGLVGNEANSVQARKRPLSSMSPTLVFRDGKPVMSLGAAGGPTIITQVVQALVNMIDLDMTPQQALAAPRVHHQWRPDMTFTEQSLPLAVQQSLQAMGHTLSIRPYSGTSVVVRAGESGFEAATEPRLVNRNLPQ